MNIKKLLDGESIMGLIMLGLIMWGVHYTYHRFKELEQKNKQEIEQLKQMFLKQLEKEKQLAVDLHYKKMDTTELIKRFTEIISIGANNQTVELAKIIEELVESESISEVKKLEISIKLHQIRHWNFISPKPESIQPQEITN